VFRNGQFGGTVTAGNSSQMSDGAGAVLLASEQAIKDYGLTPLARFVSFSVAGVRPEVMGIGPIAAIPKALKQAGLTQDQLDWIELNEAFAAQSLAVIRDSASTRPRSTRWAARSPGPPAGCDRRDPHRNPAARPASSPAEVRHGDDVHRHRHGRGGYFRGAVSKALPRWASWRGSGWQGCPGHAVNPSMGSMAPSMAPTVPGSPANPALPASPRRRDEQRQGWGQIPLLRKGSDPNEKGSQWLPFCFCFCL
jgi:hypothetical protein